MGYLLRRQLREALPATVTGLQRALALEIADDANDTTRLSFVSLDSLVRWTAAKDEKVVRDSLRRLSNAGWEFRVPVGVGRDGRKLYAVQGRQMTFRVPDFAAPATTGEATTVVSEATTVATPQHEEATTVASQATTVASETTPVASEATTAGPFPSIPSLPSQIPSTTSPASAVEDEEQPLPAAESFGAFWLIFPKRRDKEAARAAWAKAIKRGADPAAVIEAATTYARERAGQDPKYTKHPATWLNKGCYDDEPEQPRPHLRAVSGDWQPYKQPTPDAYANDLGF